MITGMGLVSVFGNNVDSYYDKLLSGESGITPIDRFDASKFPTRFGGQIRGFSAEGYIDGKNDRRLDDCLRYCIVAGKKALEDADLGGDKLSKVVPFCFLDVNCFCLNMHPFRESVIVCVFHACILLNYVSCSPVFFLIIIFVSITSGRLTEFFVNL